MEDKEKQIEINTPTVQCEAYSQNDLVVISKEEYYELKQARTLLEFREETIKSLEDANIRYAKALELKVNEKERMETAEKAFELVKKIIDKKYAIETTLTKTTLSNIINHIEKEFAKQFDVKIKE